MGALKFILATCIAVGGVALGDEPLAVTNEGGPPSSASQAEVKDVLSFSLRMEPSFSAGSPVSQGFSLDSVRLSAEGGVGTVDYRLSLGQTREFSGALLTQITPVEAFIDIPLGGTGAGVGEPAVYAKFGMFTPMFHPLWSPDLSAIDVPDYSSVHQDVLIGRDLGMELALESQGREFQVGVGVFNGNGITAINSNNSKVFTGFLRKSYPGPAADFTVGVSSFYLLQSNQGSVNFKSNLLGLVYIESESRSLGLKGMAEIFGGRFEDSTRGVSPWGGAVSVWYELDDGLRLYARYEKLAKSPVGQGLGTDHLSIGPIVDLLAGVKLFANLDQSWYSNRTAETKVILRVRLDL